jgi:NADH-quinone oxidoreductase E subunit
VSFHPDMAYDARFQKSVRELTDAGPAFAYTPENLVRFQEIIVRYPPDQKRSAVLPALYLVQHQQGYITGESMKYVAGLLEITPADVEDVVTYYTMFLRKPVGKYLLSVCRTLSCAVNGAERVTEALCQALHIQPGETDPTGTFTVQEVECLGACDRAPVIMVNDAWQERQTPEGVKQLLDDLRTRGEASLTGCHLVMENK